MKKALEVSIIQILSFSLKNLGKQKKFIYDKYRQFSFCDLDGNLMKIIGQKGILFFHYLFKSIKY